MAKPTWALLPPSALPDGTNGIDLLGTIIFDIEYPLADGVPRRVQAPPLQPLFDRTADSEAELVLGATRSNNTRVYLTTLFSAASAFGRDTNATLATGRITTRLLKGHTPVFNTILQESKSEITSLLQGYKRAYLVVGTKTCWNASIATTDGSSRDTNFAARLPATQIAASAVGVPDVSGLINATSSGGGAQDGVTVMDNSQPLDITVQHGHNRTTKADSNFTAIGSRLFAIQCKKIQLNPAWRSERQMKLTNSYAIAKDRGMYGATDNEDDNVVEDEDADEDDDEGGEDEDIKLGVGEWDGTKIGKVVFGEF